MSKENGFAPIRRGLWEHIRDGRMSHLESLAFVYICSQADTRTGIWRGSAKSLAGELGMKERTARDLLEKMEHGDYIRRFAVPGLHSCYPILIHKFPITQGEHNGEQLNALESKSPADLAYFSCEQGGEQSVEHGVEHGAAQRRIENREKRKEKKNPAAKTTPSSDPRFQSFIDFAFRAFEQKHGQKPTWGPKDFKALKAMLASNKGLEPGELERRFRNYLASTELFTRKQGDALWYFCAHTDSFLAGPMLAVQGKGTNGKLSTNEAVAITMQGAATNARRPN